MAVIAFLVAGWIPGSQAGESASRLAGYPDWLRKEKLVALWGWLPPEIMPKAKGHGFNLYVKTFWNLQGDFADRGKVESAAKLAARTGMNFLPCAYLCSYPQRRMIPKLKLREAVSQEGLASSRVKPEVEMIACPLDERYWEAVVFSAAMNVIELSRQPGMESIKGLHLDPEIYGTSYKFGGFYDANKTCYCDYCFNGFRKGEAGKELPELKPAERHPTLVSGGLLFEYARYLEAACTKILDSIGKRIHEARPDFVLAMYPGMNQYDVEYYHRALVKGLSAHCHFLMIDAHYYMMDWCTGGKKQWYDRHRLPAILGPYSNFWLEWRDTSVSLKQVMFSLGTHFDGFWFYCERPPTENQWAELQAAAKEVQQVHERTRAYTEDGEPVPDSVRFASVAADQKWEGYLHPLLWRSGDTYLLQVSFLHAYRDPVVQLALDGIAPGKYWIRNALKPEAVLPDNEDAWTPGTLAQGFHLKLEPWSETFWLIEPAERAAAHAQELDDQIAAAKKQRKKTDLKPVARQTSGQILAAYLDWKAEHIRKVKEGPFTLEMDPLVNEVVVRAPSHTVWLSPRFGAQVAHWIVDNETGYQVVGPDLYGRYRCGLLRDKLGAGGWDYSRRRYWLAGSKAERSRAVIDFEGINLASDGRSPEFKIHKRYIIDAKRPKLRAEVQVTNISARRAELGFVWRDCPHLAPPEKGQRRPNEVVEDMDVVAPLNGQNELIRGAAIQPSRTFARPALTGNAIAAFCRDGNHALVYRINPKQLDKYYVWQTVLPTYLEYPKSDALEPGESWKCWIELEYLRGVPPEKLPLGN